VKKTDTERREFKAGRFATALDKYQKALRYLDQNPVVPDDAPNNIAEKLRTT
jgi:peptidyl-prolyl isomerase D